MRFPRRRYHDSAAQVFPTGLSGYRRGLGGSPSPVAVAIAQAEGANVPGSIPARANNPGDLEIGDIGYGTISGKTIFPSVDAGYAALQNQINLITTGQSKAGYNPGMSISQVGQLYSGGDPNWANNVASALGTTPEANFAAAAGSGSAASTTDSTTLLAALPDQPSDTDYTPWIIGGAVAVAVAYALT